MVDKKYRKQGIATKLIDEAKKYFQNNNVKYFNLFTSVNNSNAILLYKKHGMEELYITLYGEIK